MQRYGASGVPTCTPVRGACHGGNCQILATFEGKTACINPEDLELNALDKSWRREAVSSDLVVKIFLAKTGIELSAHRLGIYENSDSARRKWRDSFVEWGSWVNLALRNGGLLGGKGGFGAALRASAKRKGGKATTYFGACRDLNGRRLRHVNNEIRLKVWREERESMEAQGKSWDIEDSAMTSTKSGVSGWFLDVPTWADPISKSSARTAFLSTLIDDKNSNKQRKSTICRDWSSARDKSKLSSIPKNAPKWWGCPRGSACLFAHGYDELTENGRRDYNESMRRERQQKEVEVLHSFIEDGTRRKEAIASSIMEGMQRSKLEALSRDNVDGSITDVPSSGSAEVSDSLKPFSVKCLCGQIAVGDTGEVEGLSPFATAAILDVAVNRGVWYFEVEVVYKEIDCGSAALQIGCATPMFQANQDNNDGVGDTPHSWGFDPFRMTVFRQGKGLQAKAVEDTVETADMMVIGCCMNLNEKYVSWSVNGVDIIVPEENEKMISLITDSMASMLYFPTVSIEQGLCVRFNLGERSFKYMPKTLLDHSVRGFLGDGDMYSNLPSASSSSSVQVSNKRSFASENVERIESTEKLQTSMVSLDDYASKVELESLGLDALKTQLQLRGLKCGGTLAERAARLFSVKGCDPSEYAPGIRAKKKKKKI